MPPKPYAVLDFRIRAVASGRGRPGVGPQGAPSATVAPPVFRGGFLRLHPAANTGDMPEELCSNRCLSRRTGWVWLASSCGLGSSAGAVIEGALKGEVLGLLAWAEMEIEGVAPRVPVKVTFDPADLLNALARVAANPWLR